MMTDVLIIGAGPAGLTAALYVIRAGFSAVVIEKNVYGGQVAITNEIENYPGITNISGVDLSLKMFEQVSKMGCKFIFEEVKSVDLVGEVKTVNTSTKQLQAKTVIITNGLKRRKLGCKGEDQFYGKGVSYCSTCDGALFKEKNVCVVGGGNTALEDALYLSNICKEVMIIVRRDHFRGEQYLVDLVEQKNNIVCKMESKIEQIQGNNVVESVNISSKDGNTQKVDVSAVFIAIGYEPDNSMYKGQLNLDEDNYFISNEECTTNISGVFVAGDCRRKLLKQIVTAVSDGAIAATQAVRFISENK